MIYYFNLKMNRIKNRNNHLDQFYTSPELIEECVNCIKEICKPSYIIDTSCGNNLFAIKMNLPYKSYDIDPPKDYKGEITKTNFLKEEIQIKENTLMGFNPPFGWRSELAKQFILKMLLLQPKYIALILLEPSTTNKWQFTNYKTIFEKEIFCHVPCRFFVLEFENTNFPLKTLLPRKSTKYKTTIDNLKITREKRLLNNDCLMVRFTGVNSGLEYYIQYKKYIFHILFDSFKTKNYNFVLKQNFTHKVDTTTFTKIYYPFENIKQIKQIVLYLHKNAPNVMNLKSIRYNFTTFDVCKIVDKFLQKNVSNNNDK